MVRVRTPASGTHGMKPQLSSPRQTLTGREQFVRVIYDGHNAQLWVDSECAAKEAFSLGRALPFLAEPLGAMIVLCTSLSALTIASFLPRRRPRRRPGLGIALPLACGAGAWLLLLANGVWDHVSDFDAPAALLGALALAATVPLLQSDSLDTPSGTPGATPSE